MWNITGYDWNAPSAEFIVRKVSPKIHGGDVILLHDGGHAAFGTYRSATVVAVDRLITRFLAEGFEFLTIPKMMDPRL
jgi:peptidoglycan/xylan/chitin deacetylase (PgdA/CDA1 family)